MLENLYPKRSLSLSHYCIFAFFLETLEWSIRKVYEVLLTDYFTFVSTKITLLFFLLTKFMIFYERDMQKDY